MENNDNIDFGCISGIKCSNQNNGDDEYTQNENIFFYDGNNKKKENYENRGNNKKMLEKNLNEMQMQFKNLSLKFEEIINSKKFNFKNFLVNNLNIQIAPRLKTTSVKSEEKTIQTEEKKIEIQERIKEEKIDSPKNSSISNDADSLFDVFVDKFKKNNNDSILLGKKRDTNDNQNIKEDEGMQLFKEIEDLCKQNENIHKSSNIRIMYNENTSAEILYDDRAIVNIYFEDHKINKLINCTNNDIIFKEKEIIKHLKKIKKTILKNINSN